MKNQNAFRRVFLGIELVLLPAIWGSTGEILAQEAIVRQDQRLGISYSVFAL